MKNTIVFALFIVSLLFTSCVENSSVRKRVTSAGKSSGTPSGSTGLPTDSTIGGGTSTVLTSKVELTHFVDPIDGTYKKKVTIPRNYKGYLYIAGLNVTALQGKILKVRFYLGRDRQPIVLNATIARAPGITPKTDIEVLVVDMVSRPFLKTRLIYDLYDYTDYAGSDTANFISDNRDGGLYCRGLRNEDDPTFTPTDANPTCSGASSTCKYSYAKILDSTFYDPLTGLGFSPSAPSAFTGVGYTYSLSYLRNMCIPDTSTISEIKQLFNTTNLTSYNVAFTAYQDYLNPVIAGSQQNLYLGPFRSVNKAEWDISGAAITASGAGLFDSCTGPAMYAGDPGSYCTGSYLFPRQGKLDSTSGYKEIYGSLKRMDAQTPEARSFKDTSDPSTPISSVFVDGCNIRAINYNSTTGLGIGSCNITANVELFYEKDGKEVQVTSEKTLKLQLVRDSLINSEGKEVLSSAFKSCSSSGACGSGECCFNGRCWSKDLVTQCLDEVPGTGNLEIGSSCRSDFECGSLCCNQSTGTCSPHSTTGSTPILCSKAPGQQCVSRDYCRKEYVTTCKVYKDGLNLDGTPKCSIRCLPVETYSDCKSGFCVPPAAPADPADPDDPEVCAAAPTYQ